MNIVLAKLISGEMIIGCLYEPDNKIAKCMQLKPIPTGQNQVQIAMAPVFAGLTEDLVDIDMSKIITYTHNCPKDISDKYTEFRTGLVITPNMPKNITSNNITPLGEYR